MNLVETYPGYYVNENVQIKTRSNVRTHLIDRSLMKASLNNNANTYQKAIRLIFVIILISIAFTFGTLIQAFASTHTSTSTVSNKQSSLDNSSIKERIHVVKGDTLWDIAIKYAPMNQSIRSYINKLAKLNSLQSSNLQEGQALYLP